MALAQLSSAPPPVPLCAGDLGRAKWLAQQQWLLLEKEGREIVWCASQWLILCTWSLVQVCGLASTHDRPRLCGSAAGEAVNQGPCMLRGHSSQSLQRATSV